MAQGYVIGSLFLQLVVRLDELSMNLLYNALNYLILSIHTVKRMLIPNISFFCDRGIVHCHNWNCCFNKIST